MREVKNHGGTYVFLAHPGSGAFERLQFESYDSQLGLCRHHVPTSADETWEAAELECYRGMDQKSTAGSGSNGTSPLSCGCPFWVFQGCHASRGNIKHSVKFQALAMWGRVDRDTQLATCPVLLAPEMQGPSRWLRSHRLGTLAVDRRSGVGMCRIDGPLR